MKTSDVLKHFEGTTKTAEALGITQPAVSGWGSHPPLGRQYQIEKITNGKLKVSKPAIS